MISATSPAVFLADPYLIIGDCLDITSEAEGLETAWGAPALIRTGQNIIPAPVVPTYGAHRLDPIYSNMIQY